MKEKRCKRIAIAASEAAAIAGIHLRTAQRLLAKIRERTGKQKRQFVSIAEFCAFTGFVEQDVFNMLNNF
ncbi:hypothetical protein MKQ68_16635 [Chitinophaga horti]|uniref:Uncharacterized protein n=1 Tax=Chitinophaga horti TaxID=2920382 RepID=A0ABY6IWH3_9BACT|nr:hypothetical protein [Chitinophaga horti]UYQ91716.1 hypothetical protein MKQ68_16635 [Chitinophaga horti]